MRALLVGLLCVAACGGPPELQPEPTASGSTRVGPRSLRATRGAAVVSLIDAPGPLIDGNAPPPPPGTPPSTHAALQGSCSGNALICSEAGGVVRAAATFDEAAEGLRGIGFDVQLD